MKGRLRIITISIAWCLMAAIAIIPGFAETMDTDSADVGLIVTGPSETATATVTETPTETATATETSTATETPTATATVSPTPTETASEGCPHAASEINPNLLAARAAQQYPLGTPCNPGPGKVAVAVTGLPNTGTHAGADQALTNTALMVATGLTLIGAAIATAKKRS